MNVLLLVPGFEPGFMRNARWDGMTISGSNWYPIFMAYCTGLLEREGHEAKLVDAQVERLSHEQVCRIAQEFSPHLTVIYFSTKMLGNDLAIGERIHDLTDSEVVLGGRGASFYPAGV